MVNSKIIGTGSYLPDRIVTNKDLESMVEGFDENIAGKSFQEWTLDVTGIEQRYYVRDGEDIDEKSDNRIGYSENMAVKASKKAIEAAGINPKEIDLVIVATFTSSMTIPNPSCIVNHYIGSEGKDVGAFPNNNACAGFIYALIEADVNIRAGEAKTVLVVATETLSTIINFKDPKTAILFGDGAGAAVLRASKEQGIISNYRGSRYSPEHLVLKNTNLQDAREILTEAEKRYVEKAYIQMAGGPKVLKNAVDTMLEALIRALGKKDYKLSHLNAIIPHQANERITKSLEKRLELRGARKGVVCNNIATFGNTSGASVAISLDKAVRGEIPNYKINPGDLVGLTAVGGGYTYAALILRY
jgi:3-oxoacyl-[acyl-carrier-protein] synthase-3